MRKTEIKTSFLIKKEYLNVIHKRKPEQKAELFDCMFDYQTTWEYTTKSERVEDMMTAMIDYRNKNDERYDEVCEKNRQIALDREKRKKQKDTNVHERTQSWEMDTNSTDKNRLDKIWLDENRLDKEKIIDDKSSIKKENRPTDEFDDALNEFIKMRKQIRKPITEKWIELVKDKLNKMYPNEKDLQIKCLYKSIENSWQWVFALSEEDIKWYKPPQQKKFIPPDPNKVLSLNELIWKSEN